MQRAIPYLFMRGGTSRGPFFNAADLPRDRASLARVLLSVIGAGHPLNIDGLGGGATVTNKVAILSRSADGWADIDYLFAQLSVEDELVDFGPTCGNILAGVAPAAIEMGLVAASADRTSIWIRAVNIGARIVATVETPGGEVAYAGTAAIDGVPGTAAPVGLEFLDVAGKATGALLPTGNRGERIAGIEVTCLDVAMPMVIARASSFGLEGHETRQELDHNEALLEALEDMRIEAGRRMGMGDVSRSVMPKFGLVAEPGAGGHLAARYFTPWAAHPSMAVSGAQCIAAAAAIPGTVVHGLLEEPLASPARVVLEHLAGRIEVLLDFTHEDGAFILNSAGLVRTARKLAEGRLFVPEAVWP